MAKLKYITGFCGNGFHEGHKSSTPQGNALKTCEFWQTCGCKCHADFTKMHEMTDTPRVPHPNPEYKPAKQTYIMPDPNEIIMVNEVAGVVTVTEVVLRNPLAAVPQTFHITPTGKRARGQLEDQVMEVCRQFMKGLIEVELLTPTFISTELDEIDPPSVGAIGAIFDRWIKLGFAKCSRGPVRFDSFTADGMQFGLEYLKAKSKREAKLKDAASGRVLRSKVKK